RREDTILYTPPTTPEKNWRRTYVPTSDYDVEEVEAFYVELEKFYKEIHTIYKCSLATSTPRTGHEDSRKGFTIGTHGLEWNEQEASLPTMDLGIPGGQFQNEIDHIISNRRWNITDVSIVPKFYTGPPPPRARFRFSRQGHEAQEEESHNDHQLGPQYLSSRPLERYRYGQH
ncbi:unnamed protein product, partial [Heligmosomoides polygyrus]|uniref:NTF2 domain-containing protein n=1 Tax=Heligmosomoides polygyrus TaxID=6339 RepID=A0A183G7M1_HELPZ